MENSRILTFYLHEKLRRRAASGRHNFINKIVNVVTAVGYQVEFQSNQQDAIWSSLDQPGYAMFHMDDPFHDRAMTMRKMYQFPFWAIEDSAKRWNWNVARTQFPADQAKRQEADAFYGFWQKRQFQDTSNTPSRDGFVYVALQGKFLEHRSFQSCSPLEMLKSVLEHDRNRSVVVGLHPNEDYGPAELFALQQLEQKYDRLTIQVGNMADLLAGCDYVVTQNSSAAFFGYFFAKPAVLFGKVDFHHIAANVQELGVAEALALGPQLTPDYAGYVHWFWQQMSVNAGHETAEEKIRDRLIGAGWPL